MIEIILKTNFLGSDGFVDGWVKLLLKGLGTTIS